MKDRQDLLDKLRRQPEADVLIIGAGICGIAIFRALALQKVNALMVDRADFGGGTSATSSHNVHGGLRYLENGEFRLVREAVRQRNLLLQTAPHLIRPLPTTIPMRQEIGGHQIMFENDDGRIVLLCPLANRVLIGSTDIPWDDPDRAICTAAEEQYFLKFAQKAFPDIAIRPEHIVFRTSGVRPLPAARAATTGQISRDHSIQTIAPGQGLEFPVHCMVGGKWTPCRAFGQEVTDLVLAQLGRQRQGQLETLPIGGGRDYPATQAAQQAWLESLHSEVGLPMERVLALFERYGTGACQVAAHIAAGPDEPLHYHAQYSRREIAFMAQRERVVHLDDLLLRRASIAFLGELTPPLLEELAGVVGETLGWPAAHRQAEIDRTARLMVQRHGVL